MTTTLESWLRSAHGRVLEQVKGEFYCLGIRPAPGESPIAIWIQFSGTARVRIFGKSDGWGLGVDETPPRGSEMGPAGRTVIRDMATRKPFLDCKQSALHGAAVLTSVDYAEPVGVKLSFDSGKSVLILNWGDEIVVDSRLPKDAAQDDILVQTVEKK